MLVAQLVDLRQISCFLVCLLLLCFAAAVHADPKPLSKDEQAKVDKAIDRAVSFVQKLQKETGEFGELQYPSRSGLIFNRGSSFFPALALLESGISATDPSIQKTARMVRGWAPKMDRTYEVSAAILFLDRLGDPKDKDTIRSLALRLIAAQSYTGGWGYVSPVLSEQIENVLWKTLLALNAKDHPLTVPQDGKTSHTPMTSRPFPAIPARLRVLAIFQNPKNLCNRKESPITWENPPPDVNSRLLVGTTDNSNTQFAVLALWAARRHGVPVDRTFALVVKRFTTSQNKDGTWSYYYGFPRKTRSQRDTICNTAAALLGLATAYGVRKSTQDSVDPEIQERIIRGLAALNQEIGMPTARMDRQVPIKDLYFLWSVERVATLYNLSQIGEKDWYRWGAEILVTNQKDDGTWTTPSFGFNIAVPPSFALLFLKRANFTKDLTPKLPFTAKELNAGILRLRPSDSQLEESTDTPSRNTKPER
jgi:hypothetical protein